MSHYSTIATEFRDEGALLTALAEVEPDWMVEHHDTPAHLYGFMGDVRPEVAHLIIRRRYVGSSSNDIGFIFKDGAYRAIISDFDRGRHGEAWLGKLIQTYAKNKVLMEAKLKGWRTSGQTTRQDGTIAITLEV